MKIISNINAYKKKYKSEMLKDFKLFSKLHAGYYDTQIRENEESTKHIFLLG